MICLFGVKDRQQQQRERGVMRGITIRKYYDLYRIIYAKGKVGTGLSS
jgi:hypothetical protein